MKGLLLAVAILFATDASVLAAGIDAKIDASRRKEIDSRRYKKNCETLNRKFADYYSTLNAEYPVKLLCRATPKYPERCMARAKSFEAVGFMFDVDAQGYTQNIRVLRSTSECLIAPAEASLLRWKFEESPSGAIDLETEVTFELSQ